MKSICGFLASGSAATMAARASCGVVVIGVMASAPSFAQSADLPIACTSVINEKSRLDCYDDHMSRIGYEVVARESAHAKSSSTPLSSNATGASVSTPASASSAIPSPEANSAEAGSSAQAPGAGSTTAMTPAATASSSESTADPYDEFGLGAEQILRKREAARASGVESPPERLVAKVRSISKHPHGEIQVELDNGQVWVESQRTGGASPQVGETVTIKRAMFGSYLLSRGEGRALRVRRLE